MYALNIRQRDEFIVFVEFGDGEHGDIDELCVEPCLFLKFLEMYSDATFLCIDLLFTDHPCGQKTLNMFTTCS